MNGKVAPVAALGETMRDVRCMKAINPEKDPQLHRFVSQASRSFRYGIRKIDLPESKLLLEPKLRAFKGSPFSEGMKIVSQCHMGAIWMGNRDPNYFVLDSMDKEPMAELLGDREELDDEAVKDRMILTLRALETCLLQPMAENGAAPGPAQGVTSLSFKLYNELKESSLGFETFSKLLDSIYSARARLGDDSVLPTRVAAENAFWPDLDPWPDCSFEDFEFLPKELVVHQPPPTKAQEFSDFENRFRCAPDVMSREKMSEHLKKVEILRHQVAEARLQLAEQQKKRSVA